MSVSLFIIAYPELSLKFFDIQSQSKCIVEDCVIGWFLQELTIVREISIVQLVKFLFWLMMFIVYAVGIS
jgi:hypothetical protein